MSAPADLAEQLDQLRRKVDFDTYNVLIRQVISLLEDQAIDIAPAYQRQFRWDQKRSSQLIESIFLGIPVPSLFMATNKDGTWELVDGVQRISTIASYCGSEKARNYLGTTEELRLGSLEKLTLFNDLKFSDLPQTIQLQFTLRSINIVTLSDKSDKKVRFDLFERLNSGGVALTKQEIRSCIYRGRFNKFLEDKAQELSFNKVLRLNKVQEKDGTREECVLRFFAFFYKYKSFVHLVTEFLNDYMSESSKKFEYKSAEEIFDHTFEELAKVFPDGILRRLEKGGARGTTSLNLFEGVAVGAALALQKEPGLQLRKANDWIGAKELREATTGATNNPSAVKTRIEFCRDRFLGK